MDYVFVVLLFFIDSSLDFTDGSSMVYEHVIFCSKGQPGELSKKKCLSYHPKDDIPGSPGGKPALGKEFQHMAVVGYGEEKNIQWECGGSLISEKFILTAAHCLTNRRNLPKYVRLGDLDPSIGKNGASPQTFTIVKRIPHPAYRPPSRYHDIGLLELDREVVFNEYVSPACLNTDNKFKEPKLTAVGWGKPGIAGNSSSFLMKVDLDRVPNDQCVTGFWKFRKTDLQRGILNDFQICARKVKGQDTCQGDSGGPLHVRNYENASIDNVHKIVGVTSFGTACGLSRAPGVYTRVSKYIPWIERVVWKKILMY